VKYIYSWFASTPVMFMTVIYCWLTLPIIYSDLQWTIRDVKWSTFATLAKVEVDSYHTFIRSNPSEVRNHSGLLQYSPEIKEKNLVIFIWIYSWCLF
jgi:hypothetical protein